MSNHAAIDDATLKNWLEKVHAKYKIIGSQVGRPVGNYSVRNPTTRDELKAYRRFLSDISVSFPDHITCKPKCDDDSCPPCDEWGSSDYEEFLADLDRKSQNFRQR